MNQKLREQEVRKLARDTLGELGFDSLPINPHEVARRSEIEVKSWAPTENGVSGFLMMHEGEFGIGYSTAIGNEGFENFTIGHELGHYYVDGHPEALFEGDRGIHYSKSGFVSGDRFEREADVFSSELLMPGHLVEPLLHKMELGLAAAERLAQECRTSLTAAAIRYVEKTPDPVLLIMSEGEHVLWAHHAKVIQDVRSIKWVRKGGLLPTKSATRAFNGYQENVQLGRSNERSCLLSDWLEGAPGVAAREEVVGLGHYGKTLTVVSTEELEERERWWDEEDEEAEFGEEGDYIRRMQEGRFRKR